MGSRSPFVFRPLLNEPFGPDTRPRQAGNGESPCWPLPVVDALSAPPQRTTGRTSDTLPPSQCADGDARLPPPCAAETSGRSAWSRGESAQKEVGSAVHASLRLQNAVDAMSRSQWWYWLCPDRDCGPLGRRQVCAGADEMVLSGPKGPKHQLCPAERTETERPPAERTSVRTLEHTIHP